MIKKISALLLCVLVLVPSMALATQFGTPFAPELEGATPTNTGVQGSAMIGGGSSEPVSVTDVASELGCVGSPNSGAFQRAISRFGGRLADAALEGIAGGISGEGVVGRSMGEILRGAGIGDTLNNLGADAASYAGNYVGNYITDQLGGSCGDSSLGTQICGQIGSAIGDYVEEQVTEIGTEVITNVLSEIGLGELGGMFGGVIGGLFGGGNAVPTTNDPLQQLTSNIQQISARNLVESVTIRQRADTVTDLNCNVNPAAAALGQAAADEAASATLRVAAEQTPVNRTRQLLGARIAGATQFLASVEDPRERELVYQFVESELNGVAPVQDCGSNDRGAIFAMWQQAVYPERCTPNGDTLGPSDAILFDRLQRSMQASQLAYENLLETGTEPTGICGPDGLQPGVINQPALCPTTYLRGVPGEDIEAASQTAQQRILTIDADAIGESASRMVAELFDEIFTVVEDEAESGLRRLISRRVSAASGRSGGSYVDRMSGGTPTQEQGQEYLISNIVNSISIEATNQETSNEVIGSLNATIAKFDQLRSCYADLALTPMGGITATEALSRSANASSTVNSVLRPQVLQHQQNLTDSRNIVNDLGILLDQARAATDATQINDIAETYAGLAELGLVHTDAELQFFIDDARQLIAALLYAQNDATAQVQQCAGYFVPTSTI